MNETIAKYHLTSYELLIIIAAFNFALSTQQVRTERGQADREELT